MSILWVMLTDGRDYIKETLPAWRSALPGMPVTIIDDSGDPARREWLGTKADTLLIPSRKRVGYTSVMQFVMDTVRESGADYCLFVEDDFLPIHLPKMEDVVTVLNAVSNLSQMSFPRQAWYPKEIAAGGILHAVTEENKVIQHLNPDWMEHVAYWTNNPSVWPSWVAKRPWPVRKWSETRFSRTMMRDGYVSGAWGRWNDPPFTKHIGAVKTGVGY